MQAHERMRGRGGGGGTDGREWGGVASLGSGHAPHGRGLFFFGGAWAAWVWEGERSREMDFQVAWVVP